MKSPALKFLLLGLISFSLLATGEESAAPSKLPVGVLDYDTLMFEFRAPLERKIQGMFENYIVKQAENRFSFSSSEHVECLYRTFPAGSQLAALDYFYEKKTDELLERLRLIDCTGAATVSEVVQTKGKNLSPLSNAELKSGRRRFELAENENEKRYTLLNDKGEELITMFLYRQGAAIRGSVRIRGVQFFDSLREYESKRERHSFTFHSYSFEYKAQYSRWRSSNDMETMNFKALKLMVDGNDVVHYLDHQNRPISLQIFQSYIMKYALQNGLKMVEQFINYHLYSMPSTDFTRTNLQKNRFLEELRLAYIQLLSNTDINLVTNLVRAYIEAIEQGHIRVDDRRPVNP